MRPITFRDLPGWEFNIDEVSANVFRVLGNDQHGRSVERTGIDPDSILRECYSDAAALTEIREPGED